jgi:peptide/nickel transport system permease protein
MGGQWRIYGLLLRQMAKLAVVVALVSVLSFLLIYLTPGDVAAEIAGPTATAQQVDMVRHRYGLDRPFMERVGIWYGNVLRGDLGTSFMFKRPVTDLILERLPVTLSLTGLATVVTSVLGVTLGILAGLRRGGLLDLSISGMSVLGLSVPEFWLGITGIYLFAVSWGWLPTGGYSPMSAGVFEWLRYLALPAGVLALTNMGFIARVTRSSFLDVVELDFVRTARSKGLSSTRVNFVHVLRNALNQIITVVGITLGVLFGGAFVVEFVFALPGLGRLIVGAIQRRDVPMIQGGVLLAGTAFAIVNATVDTLYAVIDPRLRR